ncbi:hypothetical protein XFF6991_320162 [Xanthomonas phaseoli pv. phaseoli]|uniref:Uncharacterized protein n=1 Tax=Xanthomonas campestris pv. phaseoli TaxID=317013 RepID=A0A7Z7NGQ4_XANCH|nr:hypothetical protein XFF6991_320162 [Xanthomonas phaseoli pv. phaseoli]
MKNAAASRANSAMADTGGVVSVARAVPAMLSAVVSSIIAIVFINLLPQWMERSLGAEPRSAQRCMTCGRDRQRTVGGADEREP